MTSPLAPIEPTRVARLTSRLLHVPVALVRLPDAPLPGAVSIEPSPGDEVCRYLEAPGAPRSVTDVRSAATLEAGERLADLGVIAYLTTSLGGPGAHGSVSAIDHEPREWTRDDVDALEDLARTVGETLRAAAARHAGDALVEQLREEVRTDGLTGLFNRRYWQERAPIEFARARREHHAVSAIMLDLDHFKEVNDREGHAAGDRMLAAVGDRLRGSVRNTDVLVRWGGDEFAILLGDATRQQARDVAQRIRAATADIRPLSAGVAEWDLGDDADGLLARADAALLATKRDGRGS